MKPLLSPRIRALLVDDEALSSKLMVELLSQHADVEVAAVAENAEDALRFCHLEQPNVVFLDIELNHTHGFELLTELRALRPAPLIVFVTAFEEYAVAAFEKEALDYLLKPVHPKRLEMALLRLRKALALDRTLEAAEKPQAEPDVGAAPARMGPNEVEVLKDGRAVFFLKPHQIQAVQAEGSYTRVLFENGQSCMVKRSIGYWEQRLPEGLLSKVSRSLLLNPRCVIQLEVLNRDETEVFLEGRSATLILSRLESLRLKQLLRGFQV